MYRLKQLTALLYFEYVMLYVETLGGKTPKIPLN